MHETMKMIDPAPLTPANATLVILEASVGDPIIEHVRLKCIA